MQGYLELNEALGALIVALHMKGDLELNEALGALIVALHMKGDLELNEALGALIVALHMKGDLELNEALGALIVALHMKGDLELNEALGALIVALHMKGDLELNEALGALIVALHMKGDLELNEALGALIVALHEGIPGVLPYCGWAPSSSLPSPSKVRGGCCGGSGALGCLQNMAALRTESQVVAVFEGPPVLAAVEPGGGAWERGAPLDTAPALAKGGWSAAESEARSGCRVLKERAAAAAAAAVEDLEDRHSARPERTTGR
ncbi:unnamed protein product [Boreogadus saida]